MLWGEGKVGDIICPPFGTPGMLPVIGFIILWPLLQLAAPASPSSPLFYLISFFFLSLFLPFLLLSRMRACKPKDSQLRDQMRPLQTLWVCAPLVCTFCLSFLQPQFTHDAVILSYEKVVDHSAIHRSWQARIHTDTNRQTLTHSHARVSYSEVY